MLGLLMSAPFITIFGTMYDMTGDYTLTILSATAAIVAVLVMVVISIPLIKKEEAVS